ncbi:17109_t:CDS:2, partial [Funneliformis geosporum]
YMIIIYALKNGGIQVAALAALISGYYTTNKENLCHTHLANCIHFKDAYTNIDDEDTPPSKYRKYFTLNSSSTASQSTLINWYNRPISHKNVSTFETLMVK